MYDEKNCILFLDDARTANRLIFRVLDHDPTAEDILEILNAFKETATLRNIGVHGVTTDGSQLYKETVPVVFPKAIHQTCEFHTKQMVTSAILKDIAQIRRQVERTKTKRLKRGRPVGRAEKAAVRKNVRIQKKSGELFKNRFLFVQKHLSVKDRKTLERITRGLPELRRLRGLADKFYDLYDRRCRQKTALRKLEGLRRSVSRFESDLELLKALKSPMSERSLRFLDDKECPSTSNSVERSNRRFRKMQKSVYRVRSLEHIRQRIALDMFRNLNSAELQKTLSSLNDARNRQNRPP